MKTTSTIVLAALVWFVAMASAQTPAGSAADAAVVDRARAAVLKELRDSGALDRAIDAGLERYVERQRAQAQQREQQEAGARAAAMRPVSRDRDHIRGNPAAPVTPPRRTRRSWLPRIRRRFLPAWRSSPGRIMGARDATCSRSSRASP
jgi:hypothetical protein